MSNNNGLSYTQIVDRMEAFANGHFMINAFQHGLIDLIDVPKDQLYPVMHFVPGTIQPTLGGLAYQFEVVFYDLPRAKEVENEYQREVISDMARLALDLISEIKNGNVLFDRSVDMDGDPVITAFVESYSQVVTGVTLQMSLIVPYNWNACEIPADYAVGGSGSGGSGSGGGGITLKVNGTDNAVQNVLNLVQGNNVTITDLGNGSVRIAATGGGGGSVNWGSIGGNIEDQEDLIDLLDTYTTRDDLDDAFDNLATRINNEAIARADADDVLQGNIDTVANDLVAESIARENGDAQNAFDTYGVSSRLSAHEANTFNPHATTKAQVGLGNADNTSDANKPISTATQTALNAKEPTITAGTTSQYYRGDKTFQTLDKAAVGLGNVDNTSDANKPVSTAQASAIGAKQDTLVSGTNIKTINGSSVLGSGNLAINQVVRVTFTTHVVSANTTNFMTTLGQVDATQANAQWAAEHAMTFTAIVVRIRTVMPAGVSCIYTLQRNGVDTTLTLTIPANSAIGTYTGTGSVAFAQGDLVSFKRQNTGPSNSAQHLQLALVYQ
jgi:hypothetical protein